MSHWWQIKVESKQELVRDVIGNRLLELGALGIAELVDKGEAWVTGYFEKKDPKVEAEFNAYLKSLGEIYPQETFRYEESLVPQDNWAEKYKEFYKAQKLTHHFYLKPAWDKETQVPSGMIPIIMDPGQAFGTGLHPSTRLCIRLLEDAASRYPDPSKITVIDVGTGTGILAIVARHLGFKNITAIDIDPLSVEAAKQNLKGNKIEGVTVSGQKLAEFKKPFDVIVSNILLETHLELIAEYRRLLVPGGELILSGLLGGQKRELMDAVTPHGFRALTSYALQEWMAMGFSWRDE